MCKLNIPDRYCKIDGYDSYYITDKGDVYTYRSEKVGWQGLRKLKLKGVNNPQRYLQVCLCENGVRKYVQVHRLVARYFCDGYFEGAVVNHKNANIHDNNYLNLEWVSQKDNINYSYKTSGKDQVRNYIMTTLVTPDGTHISGFRGKKAAIRYAISNGFDVSPTSLSKYNYSRGYMLI